MYGPQRTTLNQWRSVIDLNEGAVWVVLRHAQDVYKVNFFPKHIIWKFDECLLFLEFNIPIFMQVQQNTVNPQFEGVQLTK